jgi:hypothetical protein
MLFNQNVNPKMFIRLFDSLVKPILLYGMEIWGGFGHKQIGGNELLVKLFSSFQSPYEQLNLYMCKQCLNIPTRSSNMACRAELGRFPLIKDIIVGVSKYNERLKYCKNTELTRYAVMSQNSLQNNSNNTLTYTGFYYKLSNELHIKFPHSKNPPQELSLNTLKKRINIFGGKVKNYCESYFIEKIFNDFMTERHNNSHDRLYIYSQLKEHYEYEEYLNNMNSNALTRFRLSMHWLPIERGRYTKPKIPREQRLCPLCKDDIGHEFHCIMNCQSRVLKTLRCEYLSKIMDCSTHLKNIDAYILFISLMKGNDDTVTTIFAKWLRKCNDVFKT